MAKNSKTTDHLGMRKSKGSLIPFSFVLEALYQKKPIVRPMFGCHALYLGEKLCLIVRKKQEHRSANGVWIATTRIHHDSLRKVLPSMRSITVLGKAPTNWQMIQESNPDFESAVLKVCELIQKGDERIGVIPKRKRPSSRSIKTKLTSPNNSPRS